MSGLNAATSCRNQTRLMSVATVEPFFNETVRKFQPEQARRLCTARGASVYSFPFNQSKTEKISVAISR
jgi:hypothetical protein